MDATNFTLYEVIEHRAKTDPNLKALYYQGKKISYRRFLKLIDRQADILYNTLGVRKGDVILIAQPNIPDTLILFYAVNKIGAIANMVHPFTPFNQIRDIIKKTNTKIAFLFEQRVAKEVDRYRKISDEIIVTRVEDYLPLAKRFIYHTFLNRAIRKKLGRAVKFDGFKYLHELKYKGPRVNKVNGSYADECNVLLHSGSTTGDPKTIMLSAKAFNYSASHAYEYLCVEGEKQTKGLGMMGILPSFHGFGLCIQMHASFYIGMTLALIPKFTNKAAIQAFKDLKIGCFICVPNAYESLLKDPKFTSSKRLKWLLACFLGGDSMNATLKEKFDEVLIKGKAKARLFEGYGLTESISVVIVNTHDHNRIGSIGYPSSGIDVKILDENNKELPRGEIGEICIKSKTNMIGYYNDEAATKAAVIDGYLHTGDLGYMDEDDFVFFKQRKKRVVKVSGVGVFPSEIEHLIETVPGVEAVCAISIPDPRLQSAIKVFVVAKYFDEEGMRHQIMDTCQKYLIRWAVPKEIEFRKELPRTLLGKIDFKVLQKEEDDKRR